MAPSYVPLRVKQLLSEIFLSTGFSFRDIWLDHLKWDILCVCVCVCVYIYIYIYICINHKIKKT
ncbi:hypothetical protein ALC57_02661 [Trachymyrmex cornetzi]|uniref:Uncharacterized protein n=1 Tax=Trachymyrmex cornetzi TaxID=471704 RepID=A0A151JN58_9HYME|nr:hypothetical protein ALC57_02661 [Trachymyrmex cornetzi]